MNYVLGDELQVYLQPFYSICVYFLGNIRYYISFVSICFQDFYNNFQHSIVFDMQLIFLNFSYTAWEIDGG
eukprot:SAG11_NODE_1377_length_5084_cov_3.764092_2_plen_71_part_00